MATEQYNRPTSDALSAEWRSVSSAQQAIEMANAIRALNKVIGYVATSKLDVNFSQDGKALSYFDADGAHIQIDSRFARMETPINPEHFDVLVGLSAHEAMHQASGSDKAHVATGKIWQHDSVNLTLLGEEIWCDEAIKRDWPQLGKYLTKSRSAYNCQAPDYESLTDMFVWVGVYGNLPDLDRLASHPLMEEFGVLLAMRGKLRKALDNGISSFNVLERNRIYVEATTELAAIYRRKHQESIEEPPPPPPPIDVTGGETTQYEVPSNEESQNEARKSAPQGQGSEPSQGNDQSSPNGEEGTEEQTSQGELDAKNSQGQEQNTEGSTPSPPNGEKSPKSGNAETTPPSEGRGKPTIALMMAGMNKLKARHPNLIVGKVRMIQTREGMKVRIVNPTERQMMALTRPQQERGISLSELGRVNPSTGILNYDPSIGVRGIQPPIIYT